MGGQVVRKLDAAGVRRLREQLEQGGFRFREAPPHAQFSAAGPGVSVTVYDSGKLLVQGKGAEDFAASYLSDPEALTDSSSLPVEDRVAEPIIGTDESGKGDYFGPLVVAAMLVRPQDVPILRMHDVRDSKTVGDGEAWTLAKLLDEAWPGQSAVVCIPPARYNELYGQFGGNLNRLLAWGHAQAIDDVLRGGAAEGCRRAISDKFGHERLVSEALERKGIRVRLEQRVRAESHPAVAAASVLARARFLRELSRLGDEVGVKLPKGAGDPVDAVARELLRRGGLELLGRVAKLHFKNTRKAGGP